MSRRQRVLYVNPPLWVPPDPIDYPPFAFLGALHGAAGLRRAGAAVTFVDAFVQSPPLHDPSGWMRLGPDVSAFGARLRLSDVHRVVLHFSPYARLERNLAEGVAPLVESLARGGLPVALADGCLGETHYVDVAADWLFARLPALDAWAAREPEKPLAAWLAGTDHARLHRVGGRGAADQAGQVAHWDSGLDLCDLERTTTWLSAPALGSVMPDRPPGQRIFPYVASRGCPYACVFCTSEPGRRFAGQPLSRVRVELATLKAAGVQQVWLLDAIANANAKRFAALLRLLDELDLDLALPNGLRMDRLDRATLELLARRTRRVPLSLESADDTVRARLGKKLSRDRAEKTLALASEVGVATAVHYLIGAPGETAEQVNHTLRFAFDAQRRFGAEPLVQHYVDRAALAVPAAGGQGLPDDFYEAFRRRPPDTEGALEPAVRQRFMDTVQRRLAAPEQSKLIVNLSYRCQNDCVFCSVGDRARTDGRLDQQLDALERAAAEGVRLLDLDGGEPTLYPHLLTLVDRALALGFERITVTSNGRALAEAGLVDALAERGVALLISLHGSRAELHEGLTRAEGSYTETVAGLRHARRVFGRLGVNTTVVADNLEDLPALGQWLCAEGVDTWNVQLVTPFGHAIARADLVPDWDRALQVLEALRVQLADRLTLQVVGLPLCGLGEHEALALDDHHKRVRQMLFVDGEQVSLGTYLDERRAHDAACATCQRQLLCGGYWDFATAYTDRHRGGPPQGPHRAAPELPEDSAGPRVRMLDLIPGYACNVVCDYCSVTPEMRKVQLSTAEVLPLLEAGRAQDIDYVSFGGGEPTIRPDILRLTRAARRLGYATIRYQSNGFLFAYPEFAERAVAAGLNRLHLSLMTHREDLYDRITGQPGSRELVLKALENLRSHPVTLVADLICKSDTYADIADTVAFFADQGIGEMYLWLVSLTDGNADNVDSLVPVHQMAPHIRKGLAYGRDHGLTVMSRHIPACMLRGFEDQVVRLGDEDVWVVTPRSSFWLLESVISANRFGPRCAGCTRQGICWGLRADYLARYGDDEVVPYGEADE